MAALRARHRRQHRPDRRPAQPGLAWLVIPLVTLPARFNSRAVAVGVGIVSLLLLATTFGVDTPYILDHPQSIITPVALIVAVALLSSALMKSDLEHRSSSVIDPLTGMLNRNALQTRIAELVAQAAILREPVALIVGDLDNFKAINDGHGHAAGDVVLKDVAYRMRKALRAYDLAYRLGGEEFLIILPGADSVQAAEVAEALRSAIADEPIAGLMVTISFGVSASEPGEFAYDDIFAEADLALYRSKQDGRNRVRVNAHPRARGGHGRRAAARGLAQSSALLADLKPLVGADAQRAPPGEQLQQLDAHDLAAPALQRAHVRLGAALADRRDDLLQIGARRDQLIGQLGLHRPGADQRLAEGDQRRVLGVGLAGADALDGDRLALAPAGDGFDDRLAAAVQRRIVEPADLAQAVDVLRAGAWRSRSAPRRAGCSTPGGRPRARPPRATAPARARPRAAAGRAS